MPDFTITPDDFRGTVTSEPNNSCKKNARKVTDVNPLQPIGHTNDPALKRSGQATETGGRSCLQRRPDSQRLTLVAFVSVQRRPIYGFAFASAP